MDCGELKIQVIAVIKGVLLLQMLLMNHVTFAVYGTTGQIVMISNKASLLWSLSPQRTLKLISNRLSSFVEDHILRGRNLITEGVNNRERLYNAIVCICDSGTETVTLASVFLRILTQEVTLVQYTLLVTISQAHGLTKHW